MKKEYMVFSNHNQPAQVEVDMNGSKVLATVDSVRVQLVPTVDTESGTIALTFTDPVEMQEAKGRFAVDSTVEINF